MQVISDAQRPEPFTGQTSIETSIAIGVQGSKRANPTTTLPGGRSERLTLIPHLILPSCIQYDAHKLCLRRNTRIGLRPCFPTQPSQLRLSPSKTCQTSKEPSPPSPYQAVVWRSALSPRTDHPRSSAPRHSDISVCPGTRKKGRWRICSVLRPGCVSDYYHNGGGGLFAIGQDHWESRTLIRVPAPRSGSLPGHSHRTYLSCSFISHVGRVGMEYVVAFGAEDPRIAGTRVSDTIRWVLLRADGTAVGSDPGGFSVPGVYCYMR